MNPINQSSNLPDSQPSQNIPWHSQPIEKVVAALDTDLEKGLSAAEAAERLRRYGPNALREHPRPGFWRRLLDQLNEFLVLILIAAAVVSFFIGLGEYQRTGQITEFVEAAAIMAIVVLNAILGVVQEGKAEEALAALKKMAAPNAHVLRDGHLLIIPVQEVVPGDVVILETGNYIPADVRLVESANLRVDEASLTGESVPVEKDAQAMLPPDTMLGDRRNCGFMGTIAVYGRGKGVVVATGMQTEIGKIAEMIQTTEEEPTPLQVKLAQLGKVLGVASLVICGIVGVLGVLRDPSFPILWQEGPVVYLRQATDVLVEMFMVAVSLAIAAVPEGLPAVVTICLALGMQEMIKRHALIRKLPAVETLGSTTVICSDKTGTLTKNEMTAVQIYADNTLLSISGSGYEPVGELQENGRRAELRHYPSARLLLQAGLLCSDARLEWEHEHEGHEGEHEGHEKHEGHERGRWRMVGDPTEGALVVAAAKADLWREKVEQVYPRVAEIPFDAVRKRMTTIHANRTTGHEGREVVVHAADAPYIAYVKGAPDVILDLCTRITEDGRERPLTEARRERILEVNASLASNALRVLGVAYRPLDTLPQNPSPEEVERDLVFVGLIGMIDPARPEVREAIAKARRAGIKTVMVTGDYKDTAVAIAKELGLIRADDGLALTGHDLDRLDDETFVNMVEDVQVYARVSPEHKVRIVDAFRQREHVVAMTGDGVNDAPALKRASIGVAMGITGTDVAKETADMVLTDDNYASIVAAVEEGRVIYSNIRKFVYYLLSCNMGEIVTLFVAMLVRLPLPLTPLQLLVLNLVTDGAPALALGMEQGDPDIMEQPPRPVNEPIINRDMVWGTAVQTVAIAGVTLAAFLLGLSQYPGNLAAAQTMAFVTLSTSELFRAYTARSERYPLVRVGFFTNKWMQWAVLASFLVLLSTVYMPFLNTVIFGNVPLRLLDWMTLTPLILIPSLAAEASKAIILRRTRRAA